MQMSRDYLAANDCRDALNGLLKLLNTRFVIRNGWEGGGGGGVFERVLTRGAIAAATWLSPTLSSCSKGTSQGHGELEKIANTYTQHHNIFTSE